MKKLKHIFSPRHILIYLSILVLLVFSPQIKKPSMSETYALVTMMCVDKSEEGVQIVSSVLAPSSGQTFNYQFYSSTGETIGDAVEKMALSIGKEMGFSQCEIMAFGDGICEDGILPVMDFMTRTKKISRNAILINFGGDIKDFADCVETITKEKQLKLENMINYDRRYILSKNSNIDTFYKGYYSEISFGLMPKLSVTKTESENVIQVGAKGESDSSESSSSSSGQSSSDSEKLFLLNDGTTSAFKKGKKTVEIMPDQVKKLNIFVDNNFEGTIIVDDVNDEIYNHAKIVFDVTKSKLKRKLSFEDGKPKIEFELSLTVFIEEVYEKTPGDEFLVRNKDFLTNAAVDKLVEKVETDANKTVAYCRENNLDVAKIYQTFYRKKYKEFKPFIDKVGLDNYLNEIDVSVKVKISSSY